MLLVMRYSLENWERVMTELNAASNRMVFIIDCKVKNIEGFKTWARDRAARYVYELKEENSISYEWHISEDGSEATLIELSLIHISEPTRPY